MILPAFGQIGHMPDVGWTANGGTTSPVDSSAANFIVLGATYSASGGPVSVSDQFFNSWTPLTEKVSISGLNDVKARFWFNSNPIVSLPLQPHTFTFTGLNSFIQGFAFGFRFTASSPFDAESGAGSASGTFIQPGIITPSESGELVITIASFTLNAAFDAVGGGFSLQYNSNGISGQRVPGGFAYKLNASIENPTWSWTGSAGGVAVAAAFKALQDPSFSFAVDAKRV